MYITNAQKSPAGWRFLRNLVPQFYRSRWYPWNDKRPTTESGEWHIKFQKKICQSQVKSKNRSTVVNHQQTMIYKIPTCTSPPSKSIQQDFIKLFKLSWFWVRTPPKQVLPSDTWKEHHTTSQRYHPARFHQTISLVGSEFESHQHKYSHQKHTKNTIKVLRCVPKE